MPPAAPADTDAPALSASVRRQRLRTALRRGLRASVRASEACTVTARLWIGGRAAKRLRIARSSRRSVVVARASTRFSAAGRKTVSVKFSRRAKRRLRRVRSVRLKLVTRATDAAGNRRTVSRRLRLRR